MPRASPFNVASVARGLASEFAAHNIRVNVVSPGSIDTSRAMLAGMSSRLSLTSSRSGVPDGK